MTGVIKTEFLQHGTVLTAKKTQPTEDLILARNAELRKNPGVIRDFGKDQEGGTWGRQVASIPEIIYWNAIKAGYDMNSKDAQIAAKETARFLRSPIGRTCLVQGN